MNASAEWIGERPTALQLGVILLVGVCGVMIAGLQPLLLGTLAQEGRISAAQLGHAATAELLLMGAASAYAGGRWKAERLRAIGVFSALALAALDLATIWANGETVTLVRALAGVRVGVPGTLTTAFLALQLYQPKVEYVVMPFDTIEDAVERGDVDVGLLIHEGQLTFSDRGLHLWEDLGAWWLRETGLPRALGGNVVRRDLGPAVVSQVARDLRASIEYALAHRAPALAHASRFNRGIGEERTDRFVGMYVNEWTVDYGPRGRAAVQLLLDRAAEAGIIPRRIEVEFIEG